MIVTSASTGAPEVMAVLPPKRNGSVVPTPAAWQNCTATGSHSGPTQASQAALEQPADDVGVVGRRAAAGIVGRVGDDGRPLRRRIGGIDRLVEAEIGRRPGAALER